MSGEELNGERLPHSPLVRAGGTRGAGGPDPGAQRADHSLLPLFLFAALAAAFLAPVLFADRALLPTDYLMRMSPWAQTRPPAASGVAARPELPWDPILWDAIAQFYPWRAFTAHWLHRGILPFWDPHQFCGTPFLANSQSAPLYPLHLLLLGFTTGLPVARAMAILAAIHLTLAGFLTFLWLRALRLSPFAAALGGITFMFSSFAVTWLELPSFLTVACWLPLLFLTVHRALEAPTGPRAAAVAAVIALILLGGHLQIAFYCLLGAGLYALCTLGQRAIGRLSASKGEVSRSSGSAALERLRLALDVPENPPSGRRSLLSLSLCLALAAALGLMLAAPQLLPAVELSRHSHRVTTTSAAGYAAYVGGAMPAAQLVRLFLPDFFGNPTRSHYDAGSPADYTEFGAFIGGVGLLLAAAALLAWRRRPRETLSAAVIVVFALLLALGTPLNKLLYFGIPGFSQSGSPARVLVLFCFAGAWLAGLGAEALFDRNADLPVGEGLARSADLPVGEGPARTADRKVGEAAPGTTGPPPGEFADRKVSAPFLPDELEAPLAKAPERSDDERNDTPADMPPDVPSAFPEASPHLMPLPPRGLGLTTRWLPATALAVWLILFGAVLLAAWAFVAGRGVEFAPFLARSGPAVQLAVISAALAVGVPAGLKRLARTGSISSSLSRVLARGVLAALLLGELWFYGAGFNPTGPLAEVYPSTPLIAALRAGPAAGTGRILPLNHRWSLTEHPRALLPPNSALALDLSDPQGYDSLFIGRYKGFTNLLVPGGDSAPPQNGNMLLLWDPYSPLLPLLAADRIVSEEKIAPDGNRSADLPVGVAAGRKPGAGYPLAGGPLLYRQPGLHVYGYPAALPRAFVAGNWRTERDEAATVRDLVGLANTGKLGETALIEGPAARAGGRDSQTPGRQSVSAEVEDLTPNEVRVTPGSSAAPGMLVLLDNHYPGWQATDETTGSSVPIHRADLTFRGTEVGEGSRTIRLRYEPAAFRLGLFLALLAVTSITALSAATISKL